MTGLRALVEAVREARAAKAASKQIFRPGLVAAVRDAEAELATAITPDVLAAVEAIGALGEARAGQTAVRMNWRDGTEGHRERVAADQRAADARDDLFRLADRLAAREEG